MYSAKREDRHKFSRWSRILKCSDSESVLFACQRHFPAGAPTKNHPDPDPSLFNPVANMAVVRPLSMYILLLNVPLLYFVIKEIAEI